jgi:serine protease Do
MRRFATSFYSRSLVFVLFTLGAAASGLAQNTPNNTAVADRLSASFAGIAKSVEPAVVSIDSKGKVPEVASKTAPGSSDDIMDFLRKQIPRRPAYSVGSGFIVDKSGFIMTNNHVVEDAARITVKLASGEEFIARVVGVDEDTDLAVLKVDAGRDLPFVKLGDSEKMNVGDWVLAIGSPFGLTRTVTAGIVSQVHRETPYGTPFQRFIQTDAAINRGNSGGPLVNMDGEVIGVNSQIATSTGDYNGVGFALPSSEARYVLEQIVKNGKVRRGFLGVGLDSVKAEFASVYGLKDAKGAIVTDVRDPMSAAGRAGLVSGDIIVEFNGEPVESAQDLIKKVSATPPDQSVGIVFLREAATALERKTATLRLGERPSVAADDPNGRKPLPVEGSKADAKPFGLTLVELTPAVATTYKLDGQKGLLVKDLNPESFLADVKTSTGNEALGEGDVIQRINRVPVQDTKSFAAIVGKLKKGDAVVLHVVAYNPSTRAPQLKIVQFTVQ